MKTVVIESFSSLRMLFMVMPVITIYERPKDFPRKYVARLFNLAKPTEFVVVKDTLQEIRKEIPENMVRLPRHAEDDPVILETWI